MQTKNFEERLKVAQAKKTLNVYLEDADVAYLDLSDAMDTIKQLEDENETLHEASSEFGGDCWKALRALLDECDWDWAQDPETDADGAKEHIQLTIQGMQDHIDSLKGQLANLAAQATRFEVEATDFGGKAVQTLHAMRFKMLPIKLENSPEWLMSSLEDLEARTLRCIAERDALQALINEMKPPKAQFNES